MCSYFHTNLDRIHNKNAISPIHAEWIVIEAIAYAIFFWGLLMHIGYV